jgi:ribosomal protein L11 methyltransferase
MSWRVTLNCTRAQAEAMPEAEDLFGDVTDAPVLVVDEPDEHRPDDWLLHAYFESEPDPAALTILRTLAHGDAKVAELPDQDWVTQSQAGLEPIHAGRFLVHTPAHRAQRPAGAIAFEIDAGLAFGTGQHHTTYGCLVALDRLAHDGHHFTAIADIGTGTGLLAFAARALWPEARLVATDIDPVAVQVAIDNAHANAIPVGDAPGEVAMVVADGMAAPQLLARAPFDLVIANILAGPLIDLAPAVASALAPRAHLILAGLLDTQADAVAAAYVAHGLTERSRGPGEWPVLVLQAAP